MHPLVLEEGLKEFSDVCGLAYKSLRFAVLSHIPVIWPDLQLVTSPWAGKLPPEAQHAMQAAWTNLPA